MADSVIEALYTTLKSHYEPGILIRYPFSFDEQSIPYAYFYQVDDTLQKDLLCDTSGGESRFTFGYLSTSFEDCVDTLNGMIDYVKSLYGDYSPLTIYEIKAESARDLSGVDLAQEKVFRREFDFIVTWGK